MQMSQTEALSFIGSLLMKMMGVLLVVADSVVVGEKQRAYRSEEQNCNHTLLKPSVRASFD